MDARFRIRTREGEELAPTTVEDFSGLVRSGVVHPHDLVFDALTGEWAPASAHPMVRLFQDPLAADDPVEYPDPVVVDGLAAPDGEGELALELVEHEPASPEEEARAFIAKMDEERRSDPDTPALSHEVPLVDSGAGVVVGLVPPLDPEPTSPEPVRSEPVRSEPALPEALPPEPSPDRPPTAVHTRPATVMEGPPPRLKRHPVRRWNHGWGNAAFLGGAVLALSVSLFWAPKGDGDAMEEGVAQVEEAQGRVRAVPVTEEQTRALALGAYLDGVDALRAELGVGDVPRMWLEGRYLADPVAYPDVRGYWERYLAFVDAARAGEVAMYRGAYLTAAAEAGLSGPVRSLRLAAAQEDFAAARSRREDLYRRAEGLARSALALDDLLTDMRGRVTYEPIAGSRVSADPVIEAAGVDADAQARLEEALDRVLSALQGPNGVPGGDRTGVPGWLADGLRVVGGG